MTAMHDISTVSAVGMATGYTLAQHPQGGKPGPHPPRPHPQQPPPQQPPPLEPRPEAVPPTATAVNTRLVSGCPCGQVTAVSASMTPRRTSKRLSQVRQRYS